MERRQVRQAGVAVEHGKTRGYRGRRSNGNAEAEVHRAPEIGKRVAGMADRPIDIGAFERGDGSRAKETRRIERGQLKRFVLLQVEVVAADPDHRKIGT